MDNNKKKEIYLDFPMEFHNSYEVTADIELINRYLAKSAREIMTRYSDDYVKKEETIASTFYKMRMNNVTQLPIINNDREIIGIIHIEHILKAWYQNNYDSNPITDSLFWE